MSIIACDSVHHRVPLQCLVLGGEASNGTRSGLRQGGAPVKLTKTNSYRIYLDGAQMSAEWRKSASGHTFDADLLRLDTFHYQDAWRWCVTDTSDDVMAEGVADDEEGAKSKAIAWARARLTTALRQLS
jgi:hypothetical protein